MLGDRPSLIAVVLVASGLLSTGGLRAQSIVYVDQNATGPLHNGSSWCQAYRGLSEAIDAALEGDTIRVADGTYRPDATGLEDPRDATFSMRSRLRIEGGYAGCGACDPNKRSVEFYETILSGDLNGDDTSPIDTDCFVEHEGLGCDNDTCEAIVCKIAPYCCEYQWPYEDLWGSWCVNTARAYCCEQSGQLCDNAFHVLTASGTDDSASLDGATITAGFSWGSAQTPDGIGGGILITDSSPTVSNCTVTGNSSRTHGAGIGVFVGAPTITGCTIWANTAHGDGGGLYARGGVLTVTDCTFQNNTATSKGGGIVLDGVDRASIHDSKIISNAALQSNGGGIRVLDTNLSLTKSTISKNTCGGSGGALEAYFSTLSVLNCVFVANGTLGDAPSVGAIYASFSSAEIRNSLILGNLGTGTGGALVSHANATFTNCTIVFNVATQSVRGAGAKQLSYSTLTVSNCILWGNSAEEKTHLIAQLAPDDPSTLEGLSVSYSNLQGWNGYFGGIGNFGLDPLFIDPDGADGAVGTEDDDLRLAPDSPCINQGDPAFIPLDGEFDLDGQPRLRGCRVDLGAYETDTHQLHGDFDGDDEVNLRDFGRFQECFNTAAHRPDWRDACLCVFDFDGSSAVDLGDYTGIWEGLRER